ncbi:MAG: hypothetical protein V9G10_13060 [Candidatus Nanopelagicales bacterium]
MRDGVDPGAEAPPLIWDEGTLAAARDATPLRGALPMIRSLLTDPVAGSGHVVAVGDDRGRLLWVEGDAGLRSRAEGIGFLPGASWSESDAGTNAPGTALTLDAPSADLRLGALSGPGATVELHRGPDPRSALWAGYSESWM